MSGKISLIIIIIYIQYLYSTSYGPTGEVSFILYNVPCVLNARYGPKPRT